MWTEVTVSTWSEEGRLGCAGGWENMWYPEWFGANRNHTYGTFRILFSAWNYLLVIIKHLLHFLHPTSHPSPFLFSFMVAIDNNAGRTCSCPLRMRKFYRHSISSRLKGAAGGGKGHFRENSSYLMKFKIVFLQEWLLPTCFIFFRKFWTDTNFPEDL